MRASHELERDGRSRRRAVGCSVGEARIGVAAILMLAACGSPAAPMPAEPHEAREAPVAQEAPRSFAPTIVLDDRVARATDLPAITADGSLIAFFSQRDEAFIMIGGMSGDYAVFDLDWITVSSGEVRHAPLVPIGTHSARFNASMELCEGDDFDCPQDPEILRRFEEEARVERETLVARANTELAAHTWRALVTDDSLRLAIERDDADEDVEVTVRVHRADGSPLCEHRWVESDSALDTSCFDASGQVFRDPGSDVVLLRIHCSSNGESDRFEHRVCR